MARFTQTRKRSREDDLPCESTPLSKRINNLHLSNYEELENSNETNGINGCSSSSSSSSNQQLHQPSKPSSIANHNSLDQNYQFEQQPHQQHQQQQQEHNNIIYNNNSNVIKTTGLIVNTTTTTVAADVLQSQEQQSSIDYNPELNETENPYYFMKNKLLHELHLERLKRCTV